jgi:hypothetical protein
MREIVAADQSSFNKENFCKQTEKESRPKELLASKY